tara:strand:+ start:1955 stop:2761 length:807 start_codon:yes stop_codon:yes gene_type:complete
MMQGINNQPYYDLEQYLDMKKFDEMQAEIYKGFALARPYAKEGTWMTPGFSFKDASYQIHWKPIYKAIEEYLALPDDDPIKQGGWELWCNVPKGHAERNLFTRYLKMAMGAYDPYVYYFLWEEGSWDDRTAARNLTEEAAYFPSVVKWVESLIDDNIFEHIGRVIFFHCEADGIPFEHRDLDAKNGVDVIVPHKNEFIHIRPNTKKAFYLWDPETKNKTYLNTRAAWWNDTDWHGGERIMEQSYGLRIDGKFTEEFRKKLGVDHLDMY